MLFVEGGGGARRAARGERDSNAGVLQNNRRENKNQNTRDGICLLQPSSFNLQRPISRTIAIQLWPLFSHLELVEPFQHLERFIIYRT